MDKSVEWCVFDASNPLPLLYVLLLLLSCTHVCSYSFGGPYRERVIKKGRTADRHTYKTKSNHDDLMSVIAAAARRPSGPTCLWLEWLNDSPPYRYLPSLRPLLHSNPVKLLNDDTVVARLSLCISSSIFKLNLFILLRSSCICVCINVLVGWLYDWLAPPSR